MAPVRAPVPFDEAARRLGASASAWRAAARLFPVRWPREYLELAASPAGAAIASFGAPDDGELVPGPGDLADPVGEACRQAAPFLVRKHRDRVILLVTARCHFYCRFCFRRSFPDGAHRDPTPAELEAAIRHVEAEPDIREVILSGGDPLVLGDDGLESLVARLSTIPHLRMLRIHSRAPVHQPDRVTDALVRVLASGLPLWLMTHFNHPAEVAAGPREAVSRLLRGGVPVMNQSVLLAGVNDDAEILAELSVSLLAARVKPHYLHHPDRVPGSGRFRVGVARGLELHEALRARVSGLGLPAYVIDVPDGSGKVPVSSLVALEGGRWRAPSGFELDD